ncbi:hypothetical protein THTE_1128 [Thermogutta terrifontis]|uniref:Uncharacterized protein n=1 Tax=Thermogutta terrifontis TaxID=1331910 RepID=A0A286RCP6_9BACT|nr:hypothetical protein THTE_1128 [Thermogutta terrifontis]
MSSLSGKMYRKRVKKSARRRKESPPGSHHGLVVFPYFLTPEES